MAERFRAHRGILPQSEQTGLPRSITRQPKHVGGSLALQPGPSRAPDLVPPFKTRDDVDTPTRQKWINPYRGIVIPFSIGERSQQIISANARRCYVLIQNLDAGQDMWVNFGNEAVVGSSVLLIPRGNYELIGGARGGAFSPFNGVHVIGTVAKQRGIIVQGIPWWDE
jgi:hypothetical protein